MENNGKNLLAALLNGSKKNNNTDNKQEVQSTETTSNVNKQKSSQELMSLLRKGNPEYNEKTKEHTNEVEEPTREPELVAGTQTEDNFKADEVIEKNESSTVSNNPEQPIEGKTGVDSSIVSSFVDDSNINGEEKVKLISTDIPSEILNNILNTKDFNTTDDDRKIYEEEKKEIKPKENFFVSENKTNAEFNIIKNFLRFKELGYDGIAIKISDEIFYCSFAPLFYKDCVSQPYLDANDLQQNGLNEILNRNVKSIRYYDASHFIVSNNLIYITNIFIYTPIIQNLGDSKLEILNIEPTIKEIIISSNNISYIKGWKWDELVSKNELLKKMVITDEQLLSELIKLYQTDKS